MRICAYCGSDKESTKEHIIPAFLYRHLKNHGGHEGWNERAGKILRNEAQIKDTCANCNNRLLGNLDAHASKMLQNSGVFTPNFLSDFATLEYDYSLLERWLLKVSFNSARACNNAPNIFQKHVPYMLGKQKRSQDIFVFAGIHKPVKLTEQQMLKYQVPFDSNGLSNPFFVRIIRVPQYDDDFVVRPFVIGSFLFLIVLFCNQIPPVLKSTKVSKLLNKYPKIQIIKPSSRSIRLTQIALTFLDTQTSQTLRLQNLGVL